MGTDMTAVMTLKVGSYTIRVENRFLGTYEQTISVGDGQSGVIVIDW